MTRAADPTPWAVHGRCNTTDPEVFFPERGDNDTYVSAGVRSICEACPVLELCREWGIAHEHYGIWGGLTEKDRVRVRRERAGRTVVVRGEAA